MELAGKYLTAAVSDPGGRIFFGLPASRPVADRQWTFVGQVEGETPGVGIWIRIEEVTTPDGMVMPAPGPYTTLIRWEWVVTAVLTTEKPTARPAIEMPTKPEGS